MIEPTGRTRAMLKKHIFEHFFVALEECKRMYNHRAGVFQHVNFVARLEKWIS